MNRLKANIIFALLIFLCCIQFSCSLENSSIDKEYEKNWIDCYNDHLNFVNDSAILTGDYVKCLLNEKNVLINSVNSQFQGSRLYETSGTSSTPDIIISPGTGTKYKIRLAFVDFSNFLTQFALVLDYRTDSLNYIIQNTFSKPHLSCSTNLEYRDVKFMIETACSTGVLIEFSTYYSEVELQKINIDSFSYGCDNNNCYYHLEYSADNLEITNSSWNSRNTMYNHGDKNMKSKVLIENLPIKDLKAVIDFDIPLDQ